MNENKNVIKKDGKYLVRTSPTSYFVCDNLFDMVVTYIDIRPMLWVAAYYVTPVVLLTSVIYLLPLLLA